MLKSVEQIPFESFNLIGFSMGGYIAQEFAIAYPERVKRLKDYLYKTSYDDIALLQIIQNMAGTDAKAVYLRQLQATLDRRVLLPYMSTINRPTLFVAGYDDKIVTSETIQISSENLQADLQIVPRCGHFILLEQPDLLNRILVQWLKEKEV